MSIIGKSAAGGDLNGVHTSDCIVADLGEMTNGQFEVTGGGGEWTQRAGYVSALMGVVGQKWGNMRRA